MAPIIGDWLIRRHIAKQNVPLDRFVVRIARSTEDYERAFRLAQVAYVFQGFADVASDWMRITAQHVLPESTVFVAFEGDQLVGTLTMTLDSPAGLPSDRDYPEELAKLRAAGARIAEYNSLAIVRRCWNSGVARLLEIAATAWALRVLGASHFIIGVNPKAVPLYRALYAFKPMGAVRAYHDLLAPVQGLVMDWAKTEAHIRRRFTTPFSDGRPLVDHVLGDLTPCIQVPTNLPLEEQVRWKLPREVFRDLFIDKSDHLSSLDGRTLGHVKRWRSDGTLHDGQEEGK